jgi:hypothetical protein
VRANQIITWTLTVFVSGCASTSSNKVVTSTGDQPARTVANAANQETIPCKYIDSKSGAMVKAICPITYCTMATGQPGIIVNVPDGSKSPCEPSNLHSRKTGGLNCMLNDVVIEDGAEPVPAYSTKDCAADPEYRKCEDGTLTGSYPYPASACK